MSGRTADEKLNGIGGGRNGTSAKQHIVRRRRRDCNIFYQDGRVVDAVQRVVQILFTSGLDFGIVLGFLRNAFSSVQPAPRTRLQAFYEIVSV
jgi:hypothetical protein